MRNITNKENKTLGFLKRNLKQCSSYTKEKACKAIARSTVEYSSSVWDCYTGKNIVQVEMVLKRAARQVLSRYNRQDSLSDMLSCIGLDDIAILQNNCFRLSVLYEFRNIFVNRDDAELYPVAYSSTRSSRHTYKL